VRRYLAIATVAIATALSGGALTASASSTPLAAAKTCSAGYVHANLSWGEKCLRAGEFCKIGNAEYKKYGFYCPPTGHLKRR
jgi:hypothetical protein